MKKLLFVGKFNLIFKDINNFFENLFNVQVCIDNPDMVKEMLKLKKTDLVIISLIGINKDANRIFAEIKYNFPRTPVLCIGTQDEIDPFAKIIDTPQFTTLIRPIENEQILESICDILDVTYSDNKIIDNKRKKCVLVVDDSGIQLRAMNDMLKAKYDVKLATSGMQALTVIGKTKPDVIFLDYEMPICDGKMTLEMIRELEEAKDIPVIFLTGVNDKEHIEAVLTLKPEGYILKPAKASVILDTLERVLGE